MPSIFTAKNHIQAREWVSLEQDTRKAKDFIRELREDNYCDKLRSNCGMVFNYILITMLKSKDATFFCSRDRVSRDTGIPEKTVEYNIKKLIALGILNTQKFTSNRNPKFNRNMLTINPEFRRKWLKEKKEELKSEASAEQKNIKEVNCPKSDKVHKQGKEQSSDSLSLRDSYHCSVYEQSLGVMLGVWGIKARVYPVFGKMLPKDLKRSGYGMKNFLEKSNYLNLHVNEKSGGWAIKIPKGMMMIDCDDKESFERMLMEYSCGGFVVRSPRGGKILVKHSGTIPKREGKIEYHGEGKMAVCGGEGYKVMALSEPCNFRLKTNLTKSGEIKKDREKVEYNFNLFGEEGSRNDSLFRLGRGLKCRGFGYEEILEVLMETNREFAVPLGMDEVNYLAKHCVKYRNRQGFRLR